MSKPAKKHARRPAQRPKSTRRALAKTARTPARSAPVPKKEKLRRATTKNPAEFAAMMAKFDEIAGRASGSIEGIRASSDRRLKELDKVFTDMRGMIAAVADENARLRENADGVEARFEALISVNHRVIEASQRRDFSVEKLDPLHTATVDADLALLALRATRAAIYSPARAAEQPTEPAAPEQAAASAAAEEETPPVSAAAHSDGDVLDQLERELQAMTVARQPETIWPVPVRTFDPPSQPPIRKERARNSVRAATPGLFTRVANALNAEVTDKRTLLQHLRGQSEFAWGEADNVLNTRDGYHAELWQRRDNTSWIGTIWVREESGGLVTIGQLSPCATRDDARRAAESAIFRHRGAVDRAARFSMSPATTQAA